MQSVSLSARSIAGDGDSDCFVSPAASWLLVECSSCGRRWHDEKLQPFTTAALLLRGVCIPLRCDTGGSAPELHRHGSDLRRPDAFSIEPRRPRSEERRV